MDVEMEKAPAAEAKPQVKQEPVIDLSAIAVGPSVAATRDQQPAESGE